MFQLSRLLDRSSDSPRIAILAAHPDDETIGASALLSRFANIRVIFLTDGAPRDRKLWPEGLQGSREGYAGLRHSEAREALALAGVTSRQITWLGGVDQEAISDVLRLTVRLLDSLASIRPSILITHPYEGGHPDHDTAALLARMASRIFPSMQIVEMTSYHAHHGKLITGQFLADYASDEIIFKLSAQEQERKHEMFRAYQSQDAVLRSFPIGSERLRTAPEYDFSRPPHKGKLWYECLGWTTGEQWRSLACAGIAAIQEFSCH